MEEEDNIIVKWTQEDVETSYYLINKIKLNFFCTLCSGLKYKFVILVLALLNLWKYAQA